MKSESVRHFPEKTEKVKFPCVNKFYASFIFYCEFNGWNIVMLLCSLFLSLNSLLPNVIQHQSFLHFCSQIFTVFSTALCWCCSQNRIFNSFSLYVSIQIIIIIKEGAEKSVFL